MLTYTLRFFALTALALSLAACGSSSGGGSGSINVTPDPGTTPKPDDKRPTAGYVDANDSIAFNDNITLKSTNGFLNDLLLLQHGADTSGTIVPLKAPSLDVPVLPQVGINKFESIASLSIQGAKEKDKITGNLAIYKQEHSAIVMSIYDKVEGSFVNDVQNKTLFLTQIIGEPLNYLPNETNVVSYQGKAFGYHNQDASAGTLTYDVDFKAKTGSGTITGMKKNATDNLGDITLDTVSLAEGKVRMGAFEGRGANNGKVLIDGVEAKDRSYEFLFYGKDAAEIVGRVRHETDEIVFTGAR